MLTQRARSCVFVDGESLDASHGRRCNPAATRPTFKPGRAPVAGFSCTLAGGTLSSLQPLKLACRSMPSSVNSVKAMSAITFGSDGVLDFSAASSVAASYGAAC